MGRSNVFITNVTDSYATSGTRYACGEGAAGKQNPESKSEHRTPIIILHLFESVIIEMNTLFTFGEHILFVTFDYSNFQLSKAYNYVSHLTKPIKYYAYDLASVDINLICFCISFDYDIFFIIKDKHW